MKTTVAVLKKKVIASSECGYVLLKNNPYYANHTRIQCMKDAIDQIEELGKENPTRRYEVSPAQRKSLDNWIKNLEDKYLR